MWELLFHQVSSRDLKVFVKPGSDQALLTCVASWIHLVMLGTNSRGRRRAAFHRAQLHLEQKLFFFKPVPYLRCKC